MSAEGRWKRISGSRFPWAAVRKVIQVISFFSFLALFAALVRSSAGGEISREGLLNLPFFLDPLVGLTNLMAGKKFLVGTSLALVTVFLTVIFGRVWCGWLCPLGSLLDWIPLRKLGQGNPSISDSWRRIKVLLLIGILCLALLSNLTLLILDPLTLLSRSLAAVVWPALEQIFTGLATVLYPVPLFQPAISWLDGVVRSYVLRSSAVDYRFSLLYAGLFLGVIGLNAAAPRFWCRYLCPLGGFLGIISKGAVFKCRLGENCTNCGLCESGCSTGAIPSDRSGGCEHSECIMCMECLQLCRVRAVNFPGEISFSGWADYDPGRRQVLAVAGLSILGWGLFKSSEVSRRDHPYLIRPPGAQAPDFLSWCIRCGNCTAVCPSGAIQPSLGESGWEGLWSPILIPRLGYCDYSCNACGQVCPVQAIDEMTLESKRQQVIGKAYLDRSRCIAWADEQDCIVCEEMCPIPDKAVKLREVELEDSSGEVFVVQQPHVQRELCIGCGICEYQCPVSGEAAIRVFSPDAAVPV